MEDDDEVMLAVNLDGAQALAVLDDLDRRSQSFGRALSSALSAAATSGKGLDGVLRGLGERLAGIALSAGLKPLENLLGNAISGLFSGTVTPFANGGVVAAPSYFPMSGGLGLMGEAGAEAILPLKRGPDGALGVASEGGGGQGGAGPQIVFNVTTPDAQSFARSEGQIAAMLARSVGRGQRNL